MVENLEAGAVTLTIAGLLVAFLGLVVFVQHPSRRENIYFLLFSLSASLWMVTNALFDAADDQIQFMIGLVSYAAAALLATFFFLFAVTITQPLRLRHEMVLLAAGGLVAMLSATPGVIAHSVTKSPVSLETNQVALGLYGIFIAGTLILSIVLLARRLNHTRIRREKAALSFILIGLVIGVCVGLIFNLILPMTGSYQYIQLGPLGVLCLVVANMYAIARHGFFDIKTATVRTVGYVMTFGTLVVVYFVVAYAISSLFMQRIDGIEALNVSTNIFIALLLAFVFQPIKSFFDRVSDRVFYHVRYDTDTLIGDLGDALISSTILSTILEKSGTVLRAGLRASYVSFVVHREHRKDLVVAVGSPMKLSTDEAHKISDMFREGSTGIVDIQQYDRAKSPSLHQEAYRLLRHKHCALGFALANQIGYVLVGERMGGAYSDRDKRLLQAISNELQIAIQNARSLEEVRRLNTTLQQRIDEATRELRESNEKLRKLDATKDEFVSMASHQLRTPLTSIKGYISMLLEGDAGKITKQQEQLLSEAFTSSERMVRLIGDFLNVSRLQTGRFMIDAQSVDLAQVISDEIDSVRMIAKSHGQELHYHGPDKLPDVMIDEDKTRQVIMNFIDNAIYYSPEGSRITVKLSAARGYAVFEVHDHGIGVPKAEQAQLFTKFFRAENARRQRPDGTGVGLYLAKKVVEAQGGEIIFHSRPGMGSVFGFRLPLNK